MLRHNAAPAVGAKLGGVTVELKGVGLRNNGNTHITSTVVTKRPRWAPTPKRKQTSYKKRWGLVTIPALFRSWHMPSHVP